MFPGGVRIEERKIGGHAFVQGDLAFMHLGAHFRLNFSCALLPVVSSPFASPRGVANFWSILSRLCRAVALALGDRDFLTQVIFSWLLFGL
jgi:hypothetical protein